MAFKVIAGDFPDSAGFSTFLGQRTLTWGFGKSLDLKNEVVQVEIVTEENKKKFLGAAGMGVAGALVLGPIGAVVGILAGGNKKEVCFACYLRDGRKFMAKADAETYQKFAALAFSGKPAASTPVERPARNISGMKYFSEDGEFIKAECKSCDRVLKIARSQARPMETGFELNAPHGIKCPCGMVHHNIDT